MAEAALCVGFVQVSVFVCCLKWVPSKQHVYVSGVAACGGLPHGNLYMGVSFLIVLLAS